MFSLEQAIAEWRQQMLAAGIQSPVPLEELENHLREEIERLEKSKSNLNEPEAFNFAVRKIGQAQTIKTEFKKIERGTMKRIMIILAALCGTVFGGAMILPAFGRWHHAGIFLLYPLLAGTILVVVSAGVLIFGIRTYQEVRGRKLISLGIIAAGTFYIVPLIQAFFFRDTDGAGWVFCVLLAATSVLFFGNCYYFNRRLSR